MKQIELKLNNQRVEVTDPEDLGLRLERIAQLSSNLAVKGSDFSTTLSIPKTKNNNRIFINKDLLGGINKFNALADYIAEIVVDGETVIYGTFRLNEIDFRSYQGELKAEASDWIELLSGLNLNKLGYVDGQPTWLFPFIGAETINSANNAPIGTYPLVFPTITYNNTPQIDYYGYSPAQVFGTYDGACNELTAPLDFPNDFPLRNGYFGWRDGLTFEDFPPAVHYATLIRKVFEEIGWNVKGQIFNEEWFKAIILPHTGKFYSYNWKTLGYFFTDLIQHFESAVSVPFFNDYENYIQVISSLLSPTRLDFHCPNIGYWDDITTRIDRVANFNKYLVTDETVGTLKGGGYIAPATGRYRIRVKSFYDKELIPDGVGGATDLNNFGSGVADYGWDDNVLVILRRDTDGETVFNYLDIGNNPTDFRAAVGNWMNQDNNFITDEPNDLIAYISPKRVAAYGTADKRAVGSPLSNFVETVNVISSTHTIVSDTDLLKSSNSSAEIEIEIDLEKNERINFHWVSLINTFGASLNSVSSSSTQLGSLVDEIEIEYLCGEDDLDIAANLPEIDLKEFVSSFINQFNLRFSVEQNSKTVEFSFPNSFYTPNTEAYDISERVDEDSIAIKPLDSPKNLVIGYDNDDKDRLLVYENSTCDFLNSVEATNYGNLIIQPNDNIYAEDSLEIRSLFSATRFIDGTFELMDIGSGGQTVGSIVNPHPDCNGRPASIISFWRFNGGESRTYQVPSIQSQDSFEEVNVGDLEYDYEYTPRLLYYLGTSAAYFGSNPDYRIKIDSRGPVLGSEVFAIEPTVCSFDTENTNPYPSLRYDTYLYNTYFENLVEYYNKSYLLEAKVALRVSDWNGLQPNVLVRLYDNLYRLLEIKEFDPLEENFATIVLMKII